MTYYTTTPQGNKKIDCCEYIIKVSNGAQVVHSNEKCTIIREREEINREYS